MKYLLPFLTLLGLCSPSTAQTGKSDWPHWRGENRDGVTGAHSGWDAGLWPPQQAWEVNVGPGGTSPLIAGNEVYVMGQSDGKESLFCLDLATGEEKWKQSYAAPEYGRHAIGDQNFYKGPSATPEFDAATGNIYTLGIDGDLHCWNGGKKIWHRNLYNDYQIPQRPQVTKLGGSHRDYGYTSAPFVYKDQVIVEAGDPTRGNLLAFDKTSGGLLWGSENKSPAGHTGGLAPMVIDGVPCVAVLTATHLVVTRLDSGKTVAEHPWATDFINNIPMPAVSGHEVIITSRYNKMAMCKLTVSLSGGAKVAWENKSPSGVCSPVIHKGRVYWSGNGVHCASLATGKEIWSGGKTGEPGSCVLTGDGRLIVWANDGDLFLTEAASDAFTMLSAQKGILNDMAWPHVVFDGKHILCKDRSGRMKCLEPGRNALAKTPLLPKIDLTNWPRADDESLALGWKQSAGKRGLLGSVARTGRYAMNPAANGFLLAGDTEPLAAAFRKANAFTLEAVFSTRDLTQSGPTRIVSFSEGA